MAAPAVRNPVLVPPPPAQPHDNDVIVPAPAAFPPTRDDILAALRFRQDVGVSFAEKPPTERCTLDDLISARTYEHAILTQATAAAVPQEAPPWFQPAIQAVFHEFAAFVLRAIRTEVTPDLRKLLNRSRTDGDATPFSIVPFGNGELPTREPHNLPVLGSMDAIENLGDQDLISYLTGYGVQPLPDVPGNPDATNRARKDHLAYSIGAISLH